MTDALEDHLELSASEAGQQHIHALLCNAYDTDGVAGIKGTSYPRTRLDKTSASHEMEISAEKANLMTNNINGVNSKTNVRGQRLETVYNFKYLGSVVTDRVDVKDCPDNGNADKTETNMER